MSTKWKFKWKTNRKNKNKQKRVSELYKDLTYIFLENKQKIKNHIEIVNLKQIIIEQLEFFNL